MEANLIVHVLSGNWWEWDSKKFAYAKVIAAALRITCEAVNKYEITKGLQAYNDDPDTSGPKRLYNLGAIQEIKKNLGIRKKNPLKLKVEKV